MAEIVIKDEALCNIGDVGPEDAITIEFTSTGVAHEPSCGAWTGVVVSRDENGYDIQWNRCTCRHPHFDLPPRRTHVKY